MMRPCCRAVFAWFLITGTVLAAKPAASRPTSRPADRTVTMRGLVFEDRNGDGVHDTDEPALADMSVSDGLSIVTTPPDGRFEFSLTESLSGSVFVCTPSGWRASKQFFVIADFDRYAGRSQSADIGLARDATRDGDRFTFIQLTDTHVTASPDVVQTMIDDLKVVNRVSDPPAFIVTTGDLVNIGQDINQFAGYVRAIQSARYPIYNVVGNHDYSGGPLRDTQNYERYLGPPYYSFNIGSYHFIAKDVIGERKNEAFYAHQKKWIDEDLRRNAAGKRVVVFQHYIPTYRELDWWAEHQGAAIFSGHWHGRRERMYKDILDVNSATLRFGGIDRSPRGFRVIQVNDKRMDCEWRVGNQHERVEIVHPPVGGTVRGREIPLRVLAYDTAVRVKQVHWRIISEFADSASLAEGELKAEGSWSWVGNWKVPATVRPQKLHLLAEVTAADGTVWKKEGTFTLTDTANPVVKAGEPWLFFHNDAGHRGYLPKGPQPPLSLAWATHIGGTIHISSPVIADGRVYAGSSFERSLDDCAVTALDFATGKHLWRTPVDSSIKHSLATWNGNVFAVTVAGTLYCLDRDGRTRWTASLDRGRNDRWDTSFPVTDGKAVYAGRGSGFGAYDLTTGSPIWQQPGGHDWWPNIYSGPSLGTGTVYQGGAFVRALDPAKGDIRWSNTKMAVSTVAVVPAAVEQNGDGDRLYVFHNQNTLRCLEGKTGKVLWDGTLDKSKGESAEIVPLGNETGTPAVGDDVICVGSAEVSVKGKTTIAAMHGFDKATGKLRWRFEVGPELVPTVEYRREGSTITSSPVIVRNTVYFGDSDGYFYAVDARDGHLVWKHWFGQPIASTPAVSGNTILVATWDGTIHALTGSEKHD